MSSAEYDKAYYARNRERLLVRKRERDAVRKLSDPDGYRQYNTEKCRVWRARNPKRLLELNRQRRYGVTPEQYQAVLDRQGGRCYSCPATEGLCVDHCHETGRFRGILCDSCNKALGLLRDDVSRIERLKQYLKETDRWPRL